MDWNAEDFKRSVVPGLPSMLLFLSDFGLVLRVTENEIVQKDFPLVVHPRILRPLGSIQTDTHRIDIQPAWPVGIDKSQETAFFRHMTLTLSAEDAASRNCLKLPYIQASDESYYTKTLKGFPVCYDPLTIETCFFSRMGGKTFIPTLFGDLYNLLPHPRKPDAQDHLYGFLRRAFQSAYKYEEKAFDTQRIQNFLRLCRLETLDPDGILQAAWSHLSYDKEVMYRQIDQKGYDLSQSLRTRSSIVQDLLRELPDGLEYTGFETEYSEKTFVRYMQQHS